jgi:hypothetical protein
VRVGSICIQPVSRKFWVGQQFLVAGSGVRAARGMLSDEPKEPGRYLQC